MSEPNSKMEDLMNETKGLIDTLDKLNREIESYQVAKNNLIDVKDNLHGFTGQFTETAQDIHRNMNEMNQWFKSDLSSRLQSLTGILEQNKVNIEKKITILTGIAVVNLLGIIATVILVTAK